MKDLPSSGRPPQWNTASLPESKVTGSNSTDALARVL